MSVQVLAPGLSSTLQDGGRFGLRHLGIGSAGTLDPHAQAIANRLAGNPDDTAVLEITLSGPKLRFDTAARVAWYGARIDADCNGQPLPGGRPVDLPAGSVLRLGACRDGARTWLAVAGGFAVAPVLGSASTDLRGGFGGFEGRALRAGDVLALRQPHTPCDALHVAPWWIDDRHATASTPLRILAGQDALVPADALFEGRWQVGNDSNRQGLRLHGDALEPGDPRQRMSEPVAPGTVQLPPDGQPIVLLADAQTHGGYPRIGHVIRADWPRLAQLRAGDAVRFASCTRVQARMLADAQRRQLARIALAIESRGLR